MNLIFFIWHDNSCRFDSIIFIIYFKLVYLFKKFNFDRNNYKIKNIYDFCEELRNININDYKLGFFNIYTRLKKNYFNIKNIIDELKHEDTILSTFFIFKDIDELVPKYNLTKYCCRCNPLGKTFKEKGDMLITFDNNNLT